LEPLGSCLAVSAHHLFEGGNQTTLLRLINVILTSSTSDFFIFPGYAIDPSIDPNTKGDKLVGELLNV